MLLFPLLQFDQVGLYWYHSHTNGQYPDGFRQALVIQDPDSPYTGKYDEERVISVSDWYHDEIPVLMKQFVSVENPTGAEPVPNSAIMNDTNNFQFDVQPGKTYLLRFVNVGAFASQYLWIQDHSMRIVEVDGVWVDEAETDMIYIAVAQRYSVLVTMKNETDKNYPIVGSMDTVSQSLLQHHPLSLSWRTRRRSIADTYSGPFRHHPRRPQLERHRSSRLRQVCRLAACQNPGHLRALQRLQPRPLRRPKGPQGP